MKILNKLHNLIDKLLNKLDIITYLPELLSPRGHIFVAYAVPRWHKTNNNWGDDINKVIIEYYSGKKVIPYHCSWMPCTHYICIGSVLQWYANPKAIVWGSGMLYPCSHSVVSKVCAVRGPLTRQNMLQQGYECPEVYGDPAMLIKEIYHPQLKKDYRLGVVSHVKDSQDSSFLKNLRQRKDVLFIDIKNYGHWQHFVDQICSCQCIITSSLHAIIVSDLFDIPNLWCQFSEYLPEQDGFKMKDYFCSVGKREQKPVLFSTETIDEIETTIREHWQSATIDVQPLLDSMPFSRSL